VAPPIPDEVPVVFTAGETVKFRRSFNDFPPVDGWTYKIYFNGATEVFSSSGVVDPANSSAFLVTITPTDSEVPEGLYRYVERVASSGGAEVYTVGEGVVQIEPDLATAPAGATLSYAEKQLASVEAQIAARISADVEEYSAQASPLGGGRSVKKTPLLDLQKMRGHYASMVWRQKNPGKIGAPVLVDFVDESNDANFPSTWVDVTGLPGAGQ
jgi:hypothetical protein